MTITIHELDVTNQHHREQLVAMFDDFDSAWPGGFNRGVPLSSRWAERHYSRGRYLSVLVAEDGDDGFLGYCSLEAMAEQREIAYIGLLGARLAAHGKGVGKALLRKQIQTCTELGFRQVTLHTWAGNEKALPLYKRTGFQWVPDEDVFMRNFLPSALRLPIVQEVLAGRDWYECLEREIAMVPDEHILNGMNVYPYRFRNGDRAVTLYYEESGQGLTAVETDTYRIGCFMPQEDVPAGLKTQVFWEFRAKKGVTSNVSLVVEAEAPLTTLEGTGIRRQFVLTHEEHLEHAVEVSVEAKPRERFGASPRIRSRVVIDGDEILLETGVRVVRPVEIELVGGTGRTLLCGERAALRIRLKSQLDHELRGTLSILIDPHKLACTDSSVPVVVPAKGYAQVEFEVIAHQGGVAPGHFLLREASENGIVIERPINFHLLAGGGAIGSYDSFARIGEIETPDLGASVMSKNGSLLLRTGNSTACLRVEMAVAGPPFYGEILLNEGVDVRIENDREGAGLVIEQRSPRVPGLIVERRVKLLGRGLVQIDHRVINTNLETVDTSLSVPGTVLLEGEVILPLSSGIVRQPLQNLHNRCWDGMDLLGIGEQLAENWIASEQEGMIGGLVFGGSPEQTREWTKMVDLTYDIHEIPPGGSKSIPAMFAVVGSGSWQTVRETWRRRIEGVLRDESDEERAKIEAVPIIDLRCDAILVSGREANLQVALCNHSRIVESGNLTLVGMGAISPASTPIANLTQGNVVSIDAKMSMLEPRTAGSLTAKFEAHPVPTEKKFPLFVVGDGSEVEVISREDGTIAVDNGWLRYLVAPAFGGSIISLVQEGAEHLRSSYPQPRVLRWTNEWYGGILPYMEWISSRHFVKDTFHGAHIEIAGRDGVLWRGVRISFQPKHKQMNWLRIEVDYLTTGGSNVIALFTRCTNLTDSSNSLPHELGLAAWLQVAGNHANGVVHASVGGGRQSRQRDRFDMDCFDGNWKAVENPDTGHYVVIIAGKDSRAGVEDMDAEGAHIAITRSVSLKPRQTKCYPGWLVLGSDKGMGQLENYVAALEKIREL